MKQDAKEASAAAYSRAHEHDEGRKSAQTEVHERTEKESLMICASTEFSQVQPVTDHSTDKAATSLSMSKYRSSATAVHTADHVAAATAANTVQAHISAVKIASTSHKASDGEPDQQLVICSLCNRKFRDYNHLQEHVRFSQLHHSNMEKYMQQSRAI